jgi:hypothetical protein
MRTGSTARGIGPHGHGDAARAHGDGDWQWGDRDAERMVAQTARDAIQMLGKWGVAPSSRGSSHGASNAHAHSNRR